MLRDYKSSQEPIVFTRHRQHPRLAITALLALALCAGAIYGSLHITGDDAPRQAATPQPITLALPAPVPDTAEPSGLDEPALNLAEMSPGDIPPVDSGVPPATTHATPQEPASPATATAPRPEPDRWLEERVGDGDSLALIFKRLGLSPGLLHRIVNSSEEAKQLANIRPGQALKVRLGEDDGFRELRLIYNPVRQLRILDEEGELKAQTVSQALETRTAQISGSITDSLYQSAQRVGMDDALIMELASIFAWDINFALDIRSGDRFTLLYEERLLDGKKYTNGDILAAEFVNRGRTVRAVRYEDETGQANYFTPDGKSMRKAFLRAPVDFRRISSKFKRSRLHPVHGVKRPHRGVDYAAAVGTPIVTTGDGKVVFRGTKGGYGKTVIIQHGSQYSTLYGHMSRYNRKVKSGSRVKQGQVIGYVGATGVATGAHLHYEFRVNGAHRNPLTVKLPAAEPIASKYQKDFETKSTPLLAQLALAGNTLLAQAEQSGE
ncbi:MAG: hypothetical protein B0D94_09930 [Candidatus Sedimenticola endophacoides]|nr:MAG: hypothetical protein B0D94_09930 [Candidatus Sedimenticola endophacoides]